MTTDREQDQAQELENRLTALETTVAELKRIVDSRAALWLGFLGSAGGGILLQLVVWWLNKK